MIQPLMRGQNWLHQHGRIFFPFLAFIIPLLVRTIPEILMGKFLVGFDSMGYYIPNTLTWLKNGYDFSSLFSSAPFIYLLLMGLTSIGVPIIITLKILGPLVLGFLGLAVYFFSKSSLSWSSLKSLSAAILTTLYFVALRISWDMYRSEISLIFLFLTLILLQKGKLTLRKGLIFSLTTFMVVFSHQLVSFIMFTIIIVAIANFIFKKKIDESLRIIFFSLPATLMMLAIIYLNYFVYSSPIVGYSVSFSGGLDAYASSSHIAFAASTLGFVVFCFLPLAPLLWFGTRKFQGDLPLKTWLVSLSILIVVAVISPNKLFIGGVLPFRWIILLAYPLCFYAVAALFKIRWNWYKTVYKLAVCGIIAFLSISFLTLPNSKANDYFGAYTSYIPKSMLQNTLQLSDCQDAVNALTWAKENLPNNGSLLVHEAFYGWAMLYFESNRITPYFFQYLPDVVSQLPEKNSVTWYLIWWINGTGWYGQTNVPAYFTELHQNGNIAIYKFVSIT